MRDAERERSWHNLTRALQDLATAEDGEVVRELLMRYRGLLHPAMDALLTQLIQEAWNERALARVAIYLGCRTFLKDCREKDTEFAFGRLVSLPISRSSAVARLLLADDPLGNPASRAVLAHAALGEVRRASEPDLWATVQRELADMLAQSDGPGRAEGLEAALQAYHAAREIWDAPAFAMSPKRAQTLHAQAAALRRRIKGERRQNLEAARRLYEQALTIRTRAAYPQEWAETQHDLGLVWQELADTDGQHILRSIDCYQAALTIYTRGRYPLQWANTAHDLALAYCGYTGGDRAQRLEEAVALLESVLPVRSELGDRLGWCRGQIALGNVYVLLLTGSRTDNLRRARYHYQEAERRLNRDTHPADWAAAQYALAIACWEDPIGDRAANLRLAIGYFKQALEIYTREAYPIRWAQAQTALGNIFCQPELGPPEERLEQAIAYYQAAEMVRTRQSDPAGWATVQNNLGNAYAERIRGDRASNQEQAIAFYQAALLERRRLSAPKPWAETMNNLGAIYIERQRGDRDENQQQAIFYLNQALEVHTPMTAPAQARRAARNMAQLAFANGDWDGAAKFYGQAIEATELIYHASLTKGGRQAELAESRDMFTNRAYALSGLGQLPEAVESMEAGRARALAEGLRQQRLVQDALDYQLGGEVESLIAQIRTLEAELDAPSQRPFPDVVAELQQARTRLAALVSEHAPAYEAMTAHQIIQTCAPDWPMVYLAATEHGSVALIAHRSSRIESGAGGLVCLPVPGFTSANLHTLLLDEADQRGYVIGQLGDQEALEAALAHILPLLGERLIGPLAEQLRKLGAAGVTLVPGGRLSLLPLHAAHYQVGQQQICFIDEFIVAYAPSAWVMRQARAKAAQRRRPPRILGVGNPLPAPESVEPLYYELLATVQAVPASDARDRLDRLLRFPIGELLHQGAALIQQAQRVEGDLGERLRGLALRWPMSLRYARAELTSVAALAPEAYPLYEQAATHGALLDLMRQATIVHLACHGNFQFDSPLDSGLQLSDGRLTLRDLLAADLHALDAARLVVLSACQTAITDFRTLPDEAIGLATGFLQAGAPALIGTLWSVNDASTALLMTRCYEAMLQEHLPPVEALRSAQRWLRDLTNAGMEKYLTERETMELARHAAAPRMPLTLIQPLLAQALLNDPDDKPYAAPYYWAAFAFYGAAEAFL